MNEQSNTKKLKRIKDLISQHRNALDHKPYYNNKDQARVQALMNDIMEVLWTVDYKKSDLESPVSTVNTTNYWKEKDESERATLDPEVQKEINRKGIMRVRANKRGN
jgi:hypothetical protein